MSNIRLTTATYRSLDKPPIDGPANILIRVLLVCPAVAILPSICVSCPAILSITLTNAVFSSDLPKSKEPFGKFESVFFTRLWPR